MTTPVPNRLEAVFPEHRMATKRLKITELDKRSRLQQVEYHRFIAANSVPSNRRYNLTISHDKRFVWFRVAKVGTSTMLRTLKDRGVKLDVVQVRDAYYPVQDYADYFKFAFARNPWARLVSCWQSKVIRGNHLRLSDEEHVDCQDFERFVTYVEGLDLATCNIHMRPQTVLIDLNELDYLGRLETFDIDVEYIFDHLDIELGEIGARNTTAGPHSVAYREQYDDTLAQRVGELYRKDIQVFGYEF